MRTKIQKLVCHPNKSSLIGQEHTVKGWVKTVRQQKSLLFLEINDGSCFENMQSIIEPSLSNFDKIVGKLTTGACVSVVGTVAANPVQSNSTDMTNQDMMEKSVQKIEIHAHRVEILGDSPAETYVLQKKRHSFEFLRTIAHLRPRTNTFSAVARVRNALAYATHMFFQERGFVYVQTPIITGADCEGAGKMFQVTTLDMEKVPKDPSGAVNWKEDFFARPTYLTVSGQLNGEAYACSLSDIYTFGPTFRAENSNTSRHLAEFWMIEPEMAFADLTDNMVCAEAYVKFLIQYVLENCPQDMAFFDQYVDKGIIDRLKKVLEVQFERATYSYAVRILEKSGKSFEFPVSWGLDLQSEHERFLTEEFFQKPVILTDYPRKIKSFYMRDNTDGKTVAAMDILVPGIGEIVGGSQREERLDVLEKKMSEFGLQKDPYQWYLDLRRYGTVPHSGFGAGFERLVQFVTGLENIRDVIPFPRYPGNADF